MMSPENNQIDAVTKLAVDRTQQAFERTRLSADRTLMAWIRTSLALISFGFTLYKFFQYIRESGIAGTAWRPIGTRNLGLALISLGVCMLGGAIVDNKIFMRKLERTAQQKFPGSRAMIAAFLILVIGLIALISIIFRVGPF
jgi:putative membrane protein